MSSTIGEKEIKTAWPVEKGLVAGTTSQVGNISFLIPLRTSVSKRDMIGIR